ncbi:MAG: AIR synthase [Clostridiales bacterium]|nr:AIR synthase [Clostridiales bacterium]
MEVGKLPNPILDEYIISEFKQSRKEVLIGPKVGADCGIMSLDGDLCVISTDPITAAADNAGYIGVHIACNDIATTGAECIGVTVTILLPPSSNLDEIKEIVKDINRATTELDIDVVGGHTEITDSVVQTVLSITAIGRVSKKRLIDSSQARTGDSIVMTKKAGMEGTAILAYDRYESLKAHISEDVLNEARSFLDHISVVKEGRIAADVGVNGMHDVTEGGILGALWELSEIMGKGIEIHTDDIPIAFATRKICNFYDIDPLKLISSGTMLMVTSNAQELVEALDKEDIEASIIGEVIEENQKYIIRDGERRILETPGADHLMKVYVN